MSSDQQAGRDFEDEWARVVCGSVTPGSGNQWHSPLDVIDSQFSWSCKRTKHRSYSLSIDDLQEMRTAISGPGGSGSNKPAMVIRLGGDEKFDVVVLTKHDFLELVSSERSKYVVPDKVTSRIRRSGVPILFRDDDDIA